MLNPPVLSAHGRYQFSGPLTTEQAKAMLTLGFESAIGHKALVFRLVQRLPEGQVIHCVEQLKALPYKFSLLERLA